MSKELVGAVPGETLGALADILLKRKNGSLTDEQIKRFAVKQHPFATETIDSQIVFWTGLYMVVFEIDAKAELFKRNWPAPDPGFWDMPMAKGLSETRAFNALKLLKRFPVVSYHADLDAAVTENDRHPSRGTYGVRFHADPEGDDNQKNISATHHKEFGTKGNTVLEAIVLQTMYFVKSGGDHLNKETVNHCIGSRFSGGFVPRADWGGKFYLGEGYRPDDALPDLRARVAVVTF